MLADTGLRRSELINIDVADIDLNREVIKVWGKGAKERMVRYGPRTQDLLVAWLRERPESQSMFGLRVSGLPAF